MTKHAQITVFLIVGLIALVAGSIAFYLLYESDGTEPSVQTAVEQVPTQFEPIQDFVHACLSTISEQAIAKLSAHGGYISLVDSTYSPTSFTVKPTPTESDAILFPNSELGAPYWWYLQSPNTCIGTCTFGSKQPSKQEMELSISGYIQDHLNECLQDFSAFTNQGFTMAIEESAQVTTSIGSTTVDVSLYYPFQASRQDTSASLSHFAVVHQAKLGMLYDLATHLTNLQIQYRFFERQVSNLLVGFSGVDSEKLPPFMDLSFNLGSNVQWSKQETKQKVQDMISMYTQLFQVEQTANYQRLFFDDALQQRLYDMMIIPSQEPYEEISTSFSYLDFWEPYFDLNCNGDACIPRSGSSLVPGFGIQEYRFAYDISHPVLIELTDDEAFNGKGLTFRFAVESNLRNNQPLPSKFTPLQRLKSTSAQSQFLCDNRHKSPFNTSIEIVDNSNLPVPHVQVLYTILDQSCYLGRTDENGVLNTPLPSGVAGGALFIQSPDHLDTYELFNPGPTRRAITISVEPIHEVYVDVHTLRLAKQENDWVLQPRPEPLQENHKVLLSLTRQDQSPTQQHTVITDIRLNKLSKIRLAPGVYDIDLNLILLEKVTIPEKVQTIRTGLFSDPQTITTPEVVFGQGSSSPQFPTGGFSGTIIIPQEITQAESITFYAFKPDLPTEMEDLSFTFDKEHYSTLYATHVQPTLE